MDHMFQNVMAILINQRAYRIYLMILILFIAIDKMNKFIKIKDEIVAASDAFFPFVDGIEKLVQSGVTAG